MGSNRLEHEIEHGKKLREGGAEDIWNWASPAGQVRATRRAQLLVAAAKIKSTDKCLEIGCGTGLFTGKIYDDTRADITAIDISEDLLEEARTKHPQNKFIIGDAMNLDFPDNSFDVVFGSSVLHHLDMQKSMSEIYRVLKPGGRIAFAEPNMINPQIFIQKNIPFIKKMLGDSPDETAIVRWSFATMLQNIGYKEVVIYPYDFLHPIVPKPLISMVNGIGKAVEKIPILKEIAGSVVIAGQK
ncbi:MAG: class I SAM-dependent methyltransferase [Bacteroidetes bacterium]|nr:class I SAM-dependent methyltransferase [Bacteroidota bacterium]